MRYLYSFVSLTLICVLTVLCANAQEKNGAISGTVKDEGQGVLPGARVQIQPRSRVVVSNNQGQFTIPDLPPGSYTVTVSYVGFAPSTSNVVVGAGQVARADAILRIGTQSETVTVRAGRERGELEAINVERNADNIVQVLPAEVITSLPNTNIADAVGRLPSVSLERDEGEGKYIQIRGTEPRLSNVTIDGIHVPSPENVRNVKLDVIPSDLVEAIEVNKTLSASQDADAIGGSVNLVTKSASDQPYLSILGMGGYNPIDLGRTSNQFALTGGNRFGPQKRFGILLGGSYDHNNRGIDDVEPAYDLLSLPNGSTFLGPDTEDIRQYLYNRTRYGVDGEIDYRLGDMSSVYLRGLWSRFHDFGQDWIYSPTISNFVSDPSSCGPPATISFSGSTGCGGVSFAHVFREPSQQIFSVQAGARHPLGSTLLNYGVALSQSKAVSAYPRASFAGPGVSDNSVAFAVNTSNAFTPKFPVLNGVNIFDPSAYTLSNLSFQNDDTFERDVVGHIEVNKPYSWGGHYGSLEIGMKAWDARKTQLYNESSFNPAGTVPMTPFVGSYHNPNYYLGGRYPSGPTTNYNQILAYFNDNTSQFGGGFDPVGSFPNDFDIGERIWAGYAMNTISFGKLRLETGVRVEATEDSLSSVVVNLDSGGNFSSLSPLRANNSYTDVFPSIQAQYALTPNTVLRAAYGMGIARPNFGDLAPFVLFDRSSLNSVPITAGNPDLKPTHGQNFDLLIERYLKPVGLIQFGGFYKYLTDPIYTVTEQRTAPPYTGLNEFIPINGPKAHVTGLEMTWEQQLRFLPGLLNGTGVRANYSYTTSRASFPANFGRNDHPSLIRQAPNNWNLDLTYDKKGLSARMGLTHNDAYIWSYGFQDGVPGGIAGPAGDTYLYPHTQVDAQVSYWIPRSHGLQVIVSMLNLNNEVFGFYNGSERYPIQREYYSPTYSFGLRWTLPTENK